MCENGVARCPIEEEDVSYLERQLDGRLTPGLRRIMCDACVGETRAGYRCVECGLRMPEAWPASCPWCGFPVGKRQAERFAERFAGRRDTRSQIDWDAEYGRLEEQRERRAFAARTGIVVPGG